VTKWDAKREASYDALVESAIRSFHGRGYAATTVAHIVAGTGYSPGAFYHHFADKADCLWHVIEYREKQRSDWSTLAYELDPSSTSLEQLLERVFAHFAASMGGLTEWVLVMVDFYQQHRDDSASLGKLAGVYRRWRDEIARFIAALQATGWIPSRSDPSLLAQQVLAYAEGLTVHAALYGQATTPHRPASPHRRRGKAAAR
jgi:TetR/AcrR family transcriptional regulator, transcriptional repressor for nem operon